MHGTGLHAPVVPLLPHLMLLLQGLVLARGHPRPIALLLVLYSAVHERTGLPPTQSGAARSNDSQRGAPRCRRMMKVVGHGIKLLN